MVQYKILQDMSKPLCQYVCRMSIFCESEGNLVALYSTYELDSRVSRVSKQPQIHGSIPSGCRKAVSSPKFPDLLWGPGSLLMNGYQEHFLLG
jgi:hypothetical protein